MEENEGDVAVAEIVEKEEFQTDIAGSSEMELNISHILEKIERFTQLVAMFNTTPYVAGWSDLINCILYVNLDFCLFCASLLPEIVIGNAHEYHKFVMILCSTESSNIIEMVTVFFSSSLYIVIYSCRCLSCWNQGRQPLRNWLMNLRSGWLCELTKYNGV